MCKKQKKENIVKYDTIWKYRLRVHRGCLKSRDQNLRTDDGRRYPQPGTITRSSDLKRGIRGKFTRRGGVKSGKTFQRNVTTVSGLVLITKFRSEEFVIRSIFFLSRRFSRSTIVSRCTYLPTNKVGMRTLYETYKKKKSRSYVRAG